MKIKAHNFYHYNLMFTIITLITYALSYVVIQRYFPGVPKIMSVGIAAFISVCPSWITGAVYWKRENQDKELSTIFAVNAFIFAIVVSLSFSVCYMILDVSCFSQNLKMAIFDEINNYLLFFVALLSVLFFPILLNKKKIMEFSDAFVVLVIDSLGFLFISVVLTKLSNP